MIVERLATAADLDEVLAIEDASFNNPTTRDWYEEELKRPEVCHIYLLRTEACPVAAFCAFWRVADQIHINNLAVRPDSRGQGLATRLLTAVMAEAAGMGVERATLEVRRSNTPALRLYAKAGFVEVGVRRDYYTKPVEDALVLVGHVAR
ncbi:MAG: ribosomal protein S18-alanine N-acetyltransferase [Acidobacteriota bacterium]|nr:ribosomal protein S18-alanine N-acetyltransferase [Acidobacteriota bacterium]